MQCLDYSQAYHIVSPLPAIISPAEQLPVDSGHENMVINAALSRGQP